MSHELQQRFKALRLNERHIQPDEAWVRATRQTLCMQVRNSLPTESARPVTHLRQMIRHFIPLRVEQFFHTPLIATLSILTIAFGGSIASVSAAEQSLPGDFLYSLKLATEQARLALTSETDEKLKLKLEFTSRRGAELKSVASSDGPEKPERIIQAAEILKRDLDTVKQQLDDVKTDQQPDRVVAAAKLVDQKSAEIVQTLQESKADLAAGAKEKVTEAQAAAADTSVKAIEVLVEQNQQSTSSIATNEVVQVMNDHTKTVADVTPAAVFLASSTSVLPIDVTSTSPLSTAVEQIKIATQNAFAVQKTADQFLAAGSSSSASGGEPSAASSSVSGFGGSNTSTPGVSNTHATSTSSTTPMVP